MKKILFILLLICTFSANAQIGLLKPKYIGWRPTTTQDYVLGWRSEDATASWLESFGGGDSLVIDGDSICVIYLGDTLCVGANQQDSFYLSGDTSLCVIHLGDTLCSPYSAGGTTLYTGNGAFPSFAARVVNMNEGSLKVDRKSGFYQGGGNIRFPQAGTYPLMQINNGVVGNSTSPSLEFTPAFSGEDDLFVDFNGPTAAEDYSFGVARSASLNPFTIAEGIDLGASAGRPMMQFYGTGDSIVVVNDLLAGGSAFRIRANTTAASGSTQKGLEVFLRGANASAGQSTYAGYFNNIHTNTSVNYGAYATCTGGTLNIGIKGEVAGSTSIGLWGVGDTGYGLRGDATSGIGIYSVVTTGTAAEIEANPATTNSVHPILNIKRKTSSAATDGIGGSIQFYNEASDGTSYTSNAIQSIWSTATFGSRTSQLMFTGVNSTTTGNIMSLEGNKRVLFYGRSEEQQGADVASASTLTLGYDGNTFEITGTTTVTLISSVGWQNGSTITLMFSSSVTINDGTANSGTDIGIELDGNANFGATADDLLTLKLGEIGGVQRWREVTRSAN